MTVDTDSPADSSANIWGVTVANVSGVDLTLKVSIVCATSASSSNAAARAQGAHIVKSAQTKLKPAKG